LKPLFGLEQELFFVNYKTGLPIGFDETRKQAHYYCGIGAENIHTRNLTEEILAKTIDAGIDITGKNYEVAPSQWELQICSEGIKACDDLVMFRYICKRVAEAYQVGVTFHAKPIKGNWNGSGCHVNFSTEPMRSEGGYEHIMSAICG